MSSSEIDSFKSYKACEVIIDHQVKEGRLSREEAAQILKEAKESYRKERHNKELERLKRKNA
jgi:polyhydroxyalkanoate synthesis regulator phasin